MHSTRASLSELSSSPSRLAILMAPVSVMSPRLCINDAETSVSVVGLISRSAVILYKYFIVLIRLLVS